MVAFIGMADEARFQVLYDGDALRNGQMDVRQLAPALLAVGELLEEVNRSLNGPDVPTTVNVRADFERGSFGVDLNIVQSILDHAKHVFLNQEIKDAKDVLTVAGFFAIPTWKGFLYLKKKLEGRPIESATALQDGTVKISFAGGFEVTKQEVVNLLRNDRANSAAEKMVAPLNVSGIEEMQVIDDQERVVETVTKRDLPSFGIGAEGGANIPTTISSVTREERLISRRETILRILKPSFERGKYHVAEGQIKFYVSIEDKVFLAQVENDEIAFTAHGKMRVILRQEVNALEDTTSYIIESVLQYIKASKQTSLMLEEGPRSPTPSQ
ncbi:MAG TPA: hypothetical protein VH639_08075 [Bryobacteraceae bacterium]|jgi:hypothetical protein